MISVVIPVLNEQDNVKPLYREVKQIIKDQDHEIVFVDDGSWDKTFEKLMSIDDSNMRIIKLRDNFGQSAALDAGFKNAKGDIIVTMDGDLQNDPKDIPKLLKKLKDYDVVSGWRHKRKDPLGKRLASRMAYFIRNRITKLNIHDSGCSLKAYRKEALKGLDLSGEMHRFVPALVAVKGFRVTEVKVNHRPRIHGKTKYRFTRILKGLLDILVVYFWQKFAKRPMHFFGSIGIMLILIGGVVDVWLIFERLFLGRGLSDRPLFILTNFVVLMGVQFLITGILADIGMKNYYKSSGEMNYSIEKIVDADRKDKGE